MIYRVGQVVNGFEITKVLGSGTYGEVYEVIKNNTRYAMKVIQENSEDGVGGSEFDVLTRIKHPHIIEMIDFFVSSEGSFYMILELGTSDLGVYMSKSKDLDMKERLRFCYEILNALDYLTKNGIYHCDIKPQNIIVVNNVAKLSDLGLAKYKGSISSLCMSPAFAAPEILIKRDDFKDDLLTKVDKINYESAQIWAIGCLIFYIMEGRYIFNDAAIEIPRFLRDPERYLKYLKFPSMYSLYKQMLKINPEERLMSIENILKYPVFVDLNLDTIIQVTPRDLQLDYPQESCYMLRKGVAMLVGNYAPKLKIRNVTLIHAIELYYASYKGCIQICEEPENGILKVFVITCLWISMKLFEDDFYLTDVLESVNFLDEELILEMEKKVILATGGVLVIDRYYQYLASEDMFLSVIYLMLDSEKFLLTDPKQMIGELFENETPEQRQNRKPKDGFLFHKHV